MSKHLQPNLKAMLPMLSAAGFAAQGDAERAMDMCLEKTTREAQRERNGGTAKWVEVATGTRN